ncbi:MAG TPA: HIT domain-containing protein [Terriglobales bacterium]|nr:HIT domain-containing protein [Terriglobales bacterium]
MDYIFSPWRYRYLAAPQAAAAGCVLCSKLQSGDDPASLVVFRGRENAVMLNLYPYTTGHVMIVPFAHAPWLEALPATARSEMFELAARSEAILREVYKAQGLNVGLNLGTAAGAGIADHLHMHVVPRWTGDANFMTVVGETRILPEALEDTFHRLRTAFSA